MLHNKNDNDYLLFYNIRCCSGVKWLGLFEQLGSLQCFFSGILGNLSFPAISGKESEPALNGKESMGHYTR